MSGQLPPLILPIRVVSDVTPGVAKAAREAALAFQREQALITNAFGGDKARATHARMAREWQRSFNARVGQIHQLGGLKKRYDAGEAKAAAKKVTDDTKRFNKNLSNVERGQKIRKKHDADEARVAGKRWKLTSDGVDRAGRIRKKYDAGETRATNRREKDARALHALDVANAKARVAGAGSDLRAKLHAQRKLRDVHKKAANNSALGMGGMLGAEKERRALGGQIGATKKQIEAEMGRTLDRAEAGRQKRQQKAQRADEKAQRAEGKARRNDARDAAKAQTKAQNRAALAHSFDVSRAKALVTASGRNLPDRIAALKKLEDLQKRGATNQEMNLNARASALKASHNAEAQRIAAEQKLRQQGDAKQARAGRELEQARKARARTWARVNKQGGALVSRFGGGALRTAAAAGGGAVRGAMSLPMVPVNAARSFSAHMEQAASHSKTIIGSMRDFAGKLYLVERFGFMMNVAGQALATPFQAALQNSAMMEEQTMGIAVHLGAYARDQEMGFTDLFGKASAATQWMREQAAMLPGEAEDYIEVLRQSTAQQSNAGVTDLSKILENSRDVGIVSLLNGVDIQQGGRDYARMLEGRASQRERLFNVLRPKMRNKDGSQITAEQFNKLSASEREQKITGAMKPYLKFIAAYEKTYGAQAGAMKSNLRIAAERGFRPFFEFFVGGMTKVNRWMVKNMDTIAAVGQRVSGKLVNVLKAVGGGASAVWSKSAKPWLSQQMGNLESADGVAAARRNVEHARTGKWGNWSIGDQVNRTVKSDLPLTTKLGQLITPLSAFARAINGFTGILGVAAGPIRVFGAVFSSVANTISLAVGFFEGLTGNVRQFGVVLEGARGLWASLVVIGGQIADMFRAIGHGVGDVFGAILADNLPKVSSGLSVLSKWLGDTTVWVRKFFEAVKPVALGIADFIGDAVKTLWSILKPQFEAFAGWFGGEGTEATDGILNVAALIVDALGEVAYAAMVVANAMVGAGRFLLDALGITHGPGEEVRAQAIAASNLVQMANEGTAKGSLAPFINDGTVPPTKADTHWSGSPFSSDFDPTGNKPVFTEEHVRAVEIVQEAKARAQRAASQAENTPEAKRDAYRKSLRLDAAKFGVAQEIVQAREDPLFRSTTMEAIRNGGDKLRNAVKARKEAAARKKMLDAAVPPWLMAELPKDVQPPGDTNLAVGDADSKNVKTPSERGGNNFDFRGSRFTIEQKFADGFDADRIAILSTEQLAKLATKKTSSTLAPASWQY